MDNLKPVTLSDSKIDGLRNSLIMPMGRKGNVEVENAKEIILVLANDRLGKEY